MADEKAEIEEKVEKNVERVAVAMPVSASVDVEEAEPMGIDHFLLKFSGAFSVNRLLRVLTNILDEGSNYSIEICVTKEE